MSMKNMKRPPSFNPKKTKKNAVKWDDIHTLVDNSAKAIGLAMAVCNEECARNPDTDLKGKLGKLRDTVAKIKALREGVPPRGTEVSMGSMSDYYRRYSEIHALAEEVVEPVMGQLGKLQNTEKKDV